MKIRKTLLIFGVLPLGLLSGCATSTMNYTPPTARPIVNSKTVPQPFDAVWDRLVRQLSGDFFVINNIDKNSRLINVSFSSQKPSEYVDCGFSSRVFKNARGETASSYNTSDSSAFVTTSPQGLAFTVRRVSRLDGRINIYVAPEEGGTLISVNTKYVVNMQVTGTSIEGRPLGSQNHIWDFSTKQAQKGEVECIANGEIERKILSFVD